MRRPAILAALAACLALTPAPAQASRVLVSEEFLRPNPAIPAPPPDGQIEGACGLALSPGGDTLYVSDYYHRAVDAFSTSNGSPTSGRIALPGTNPLFGTNMLDAVCGLAMSSGGQLYADEFHEATLRLTPSEAVFDSGESTGVATDAAGNVYVDDRTHVAVYEPSGAQVEVGGAPLLIGEGSLGDAYGLAVSADGSRVYVADAATDEVDVFEPGGDPAVAVARIAPPGGFTSLADAALAIDPTNEHLLVVANAQLGYEHPESAVYEFGPPFSYPYLGTLSGSPVFGGPSGIALAPDGTLYVTSGNSEFSNAFKYSPYSASPPLAPSQDDGPVQAAAAAPASGPASGPLPPPATTSDQTPRTHQALRRLLKGGETALAQKGPIRVALSGGLSPTRLPRTGAAPISVTIGGLISTTDPQSPPQLRKVSFAFNRAGRLDTQGLPHCHLTDIDPSSTAQALNACRRSLVGEGHFSAAVRLPEQSPFPSAGKVTAFYGLLRGNPVVFAHIFGVEPVPTSVVLPLAIRHAKGTFATRLEVSLAALTGDWGYVKSIDLRLGRRFHAYGERHSFLSAGCPAPKGFPGALFPLAKASFSFLGGKTLSATLTRSCSVRG